VCARQKRVVSGIVNRRREGELRSACVFIWGCGVFPKSPGAPDSRAPSTCRWCGRERDRVTANAGAGDARRGETGRIPGPVSQSLLG